LSRSARSSRRKPSRAPTLHGFELDARRHFDFAVLDERVEHVALNLLRIETLTADVLILRDIP